MKILKVLTTAAIALLATGTAAYAAAPGAVHAIAHGCGLPCC